MKLRSPEILKHLYENTQLMFFHLGKDGKIIDCNEFAQQELAIEVKGKTLEDIFFFEEDFNFEILKKDLPKKKLFNYKIIHENPKTIYLSAFKGEDETIHCLGELDFNEYDYLRNSVLISHSELSNQSRDLRNKLGKMKIDLESKDEYISMTAHDLRTPLGAISSLVDLLKKEMGPTVNDYEKSILEVIINSSVSAMGILTNLLEIQRMGSGKFEPNKELCNLKYLIHNSVEQNKENANAKTISLQEKITGTPDDFKISVDKSLIFQVLNNLISNAIKFSYPNSEITVSMEKINGNITIKVTDQGQGIPSEEIKYLFIPFKTTSIKPTGNEMSTGLGLFLSKKIIDAHNGYIEVESSPGKGTTFNIVFSK